MHKSKLISSTEDENFITNAIASNREEKGMGYTEERKIELLYVQSTCSLNSSSFSS